jgi:hypothetical protein
VAVPPPVTVVISSPWPQAASVAKAAQTATNDQVRDVREFIRFIS